ncbi:MAG: hypothetical protein IKT46_08355 [Clostridia bacterium]|nr:hypothetical protein [Clostridia bacterium]
MIIKIAQTASNIKQTYDVEGENFYYTGNAGSISSMQPITLSNKENTIKGVYNTSKWINYIPLRYLFGYANLTRIFLIYENDNIYGSIVFSKHGFLKNCYIISLDSGEIFHCYCLSRGSFDYVSIYQGDTQIALIETYLSVNDLKYTHKLYILNEYDRFADTLSFFVLYYASYNFTERMHMSSGSTYTKAWSFSKYADRYDPKWRETHFPDENYFGKTSLINNSYGDI